MISWKKTFFVFAAFCQFAGIAAAKSDSTPPDGAPLVQLAILLDTSNSMDGLIEQAKSQLWKIANELAYAKRNGKTPILQVALYEYGNDRLSAGENWIRQVMPFTADLDQVSAQLFALRTNGGSEYCGAVIRDAVRGLVWDPRPEVYKVIFIAGNEPFTQGPVSYRESIAEAFQRGITVNTIFCGAYAEGVQTDWDAGSRIAKGRYFNIDADRKIVAVPTPYDAEIEQIGTQMNVTFVPLQSRKASYDRLVANDHSARAAAPAGAPVSRSLYKASAQYGAAEWDITHQVANGTIKVADIRTEELSAELQAKSIPQREAYFKDRQAQRETLQKKMSGLRVKRDAWLSTHEQTSASTMTLDQALQSAVREQAGARGFRF